MLECMYGAYIFTKTIWKTDWEIGQYLAKMGSQGDFTRVSESDESALLHA